MPPATASKNSSKDSKSRASKWTDSGDEMLEDIGDTTDDDDEDFVAPKDASDSESEVSGTEFHDGVPKSTDAAARPPKFVDYNTMGDLDDSEYSVVRAGVVAPDRQFFDKNSDYFTVATKSGLRYRGIGQASKDGDVVIHVVRSASSDMSIITTLHTKALEAGKSVAKKHNKSKKLAQVPRAGDLTDAKDVAVFGTGECVVYNATLAKEVASKKKRAVPAKSATKPPLSPSKKKALAADGTSASTKSPSRPKKRKADATTQSRPAKAQAFLSVPDDSARASSVLPPLGEVFSLPDTPSLPAMSSPSQPQAASNSEQPSMPMPSWQPAAPTHRITFPALGMSFAVALTEL